MENENRRRRFRDRIEFTIDNSCCCRCPLYILGCFRRPHQASEREMINTYSASNCWPSISSDLISSHALETFDERKKSIYCNNTTDTYVVPKSTILLFFFIDVLMVAFKRPSPPICKSNLHRVTLDSLVYCLQFPFWVSLSVSMVG